MTAQQTARCTFATALALSMLALVGCSDSGETGGGAGDGSGNAQTSPVERFVGLWDITGNWNGEPGDEAILALGALDADNISEAVIYDFDDGGDNCYFRLPITGEVEESVDDRVFLSRLPQFTDGILTLDSSESQMSIEFTDQFDINNNGNAGERLIYSASRITSFTEPDIQLCSFSS